MRWRFVARQGKGMVFNKSQAFQFQGRRTEFQDTSLHEDDDRRFRE